MKPGIKNTILLAQSLVVFASLVACKPKASAIKPVLAQQEKGALATAPHTDGVYDLSEGVMAFDLASHQEIAASIEGLFPEHKKDELARHMLIIKPLANDLAVKAHPKKSGQALEKALAAERGVQRAGGSHRLTELSAEISRHYQKAYKHHDLQVSVSLVAKDGDI